MQSDEEQPSSHAEAPQRFRESTYIAGPRNLDAICAQARQRMQRLCAQPHSPEEVQQALKKRREADATDNELKFVAKHGHNNFMDYYFPKYAELGQKYLPRLRFEDGPAAAKKTMNHLSDGCQQGVAQRPLQDKSKVIRYHTIPLKTPQKLPKRGPDATRPMGIDQYEMEEGHNRTAAVMSPLHLMHR
ncbi:hypothetical protein DFH09DRAFT_1076283 [Mycena vulgaris]|nr:hypothetical protein DFH09DRAFT_1076283 [Mycena vulgaris]